MQRTSCILSICVAEWITFVAKQIDVEPAGDEQFLFEAKKKNKEGNLIKTLNLFQTNITRSLAVH